MLTLLTSHGLSWAVWRSRDLGLEVASDLDVVASEPLAALLPRMRAPLTQLGYRLLQYTRYDLAGADAIWLLDPAGAVLHLDVLADPAGIGRLALPTAPVLESAVPSDAVPWVGARWEACYQVAKAIAKASPARLAAIEGPPPGLEDALREVLPSRASLVCGGLADRWDQRRWATLMRALRGEQRSARLRHGGAARVLSASLARYWRRVRRPVGVWVHFRQAGEPRLDFLAAIEVRKHLWPEAPGGRWAEAISARIGILRPRVVVTWGPHRPPWWGGAAIIDHAAREEVLSLLEAHAWRSVA